MFTEGLDESAISWIKQVAYYLLTTLFPLSLQVFFKLYKIFVSGFLLMTTWKNCIVLAGIKCRRRIWQAIAAIK